MPAAIEIPDLWGDDIKVGVLSPLTILKVQAEKLSQRTRGVLMARTHTTSSPQKEGEILEETQHLEFYAPALNYSEEVLAVTHTSKRLYPARIWMQADIDWGVGSRSRVRVCDNEAEFLKLLQAALQSSLVRSAIDSILAMSNERNLAPAASA